MGCSALYGLMRQLHRRCGEAAADLHKFVNEEHHRGQWSLLKGGLRRLQEQRRQEDDDEGEAMAVQVGG